MTRHEEGSAMNDPGSERELARELLKGGLIFLTVVTTIFAGLIFLMFFLGGLFRIVGWIFVIVLIFWDWRILRQVFRLMRGDLSL